MIVTDRFVFLPFPRTGTTFVREALRELDRRSRPGPLARLFGRGGGAKFLDLDIRMTDTAAARREGRRSPHGGVRHVPADARRLPVFTIVRNPFDWMVSAYEHRFWRDHPIADPEVLREKYPGYPDLAFATYVAMMHDEGVLDHLDGAPRRASVGPLTIRFLKFYCAEPGPLIENLDDAFLDGGRLREHLAPVRFLRHENLVPDVREFLEEVGIPHERTAFIDGLPRRNAAPGRAGRPWSAYFDPDLVTRVRHAERALFDLFPWYDR